MRGTKRLFLLVAAVALLPLAAECAKSKTPAEKEEAGRAWFGVPSIPSGKKGAAFKLNDDDNKVVHLKQVALAEGKGSAHVSIDVNGKNYFIGRVNNKESQFSLNLPVDDSFALKQTGSGSVSVTGFKVSPTGDDSDADDEDRQEIEFWGLTVPAKKKGSVKLNDDADERIHITQIALGPKAKNGSQAVVTIAVDGGRKAILGTLDADKNPHFEVNLWVDDSFKVSHTGDSPVYLTGYYMGDTDTGSEEEEEEFWTAAVQPGKALTVTQKDEDDVTTHITQVALGPTKSAEPVTVTIDVNGESHTLGTLIKGVVTEFSVDLPIDDTFTLRHNGKGVPVYVSGYTSTIEADEQAAGGAKGGKASKKGSDDDDDDDDDDEEGDDDDDDDDDDRKRRGGDDDDDEDDDGDDDDDDGDDEPVDEEDEDGDGEPEADFWGISIPKGRKVTVPLDDAKDEVVHIKQIALAPGKPGATTVMLDVNGQRLFLGTLNSKTAPQFAVDLIVDDTFTFSHSGTGTVHVLGFTGELEKPLREDAPKGALELEQEVWNEQIAPGKSVHLSDLKKGESLHITQISLGPNPAAGDTSLTFVTEGHTYAIGTLNRAGQQQAKVSALLRSASDVVKCHGSSIVYLSGYTERFEKDEDGAGAAGGDDDDDDDDDDDEDEEEEEEECTGNRCPKKGKAGKKSGKRGHDDDDDDEPHAKKGKKSKKAHDDDDEEGADGDDDDDDGDAGPLLNGPRIVSSFFFGLFTLWWFGFFKEDPEKKAAAEAAKAAAKGKKAGGAPQGKK